MYVCICVSVHGILICLFIWYVCVWYVVCWLHLVTQRPFSYQVTLGGQSDVSEAELSMNEIRCKMCLLSEAAVRAVDSFVGGCCFDMEVIL